jgi:putative ABC transport system permease protein
MGNLTSLHLSILNNLGTLLVFNAIFLLVAEVATLIYSIPIIRISTLIKDVKRTSQIRGNIFSAKTFILILQFGISFGFITWFLVSHKQLNYLSNIDLGYKKSNIICLRYNSNISQANWINLKNELSINSQFASVSGSQYKLIGELNASVIEKENNEAIKVMWNRVDYNFLPSLKMKLISGRNFSRDIPADKNGIIINETAWRALSDSTIQKVRFPIVNRENATTIIGVVKDFHFESFNNKIPPLVLGLKDDFSKYIYIEKS